MVVVIFASAGVALYESVRRLIDPTRLDHLWVLVLAGLIGAAGNYLAARVRMRAGTKIGSAALIADRQHAKVDALVSLGVVASAALVAVGLDRADPIAGLVLTLVILRITWQTWRSVRGADSSSPPGH